MQAHRFSHPSALPPPAFPPVAPFLQAMCSRLQEEHEEARLQAEADFCQLRQFLKAANDQLMEEARR